jgi:hypothetical protein
MDVEFHKTFFSGFNIDTGPGSCIAVALDSYKPVVDAAKKVRDYSKGYASRNRTGHLGGIVFVRSVFDGARYKGRNGNTKLQEEIPLEQKASTAGFWVADDLHVSPAWLFGAGTDGSVTPLRSGSSARHQIAVSDEGRKQRQSETALRDGYCENVYHACGSQ